MNTNAKKNRPVKKVTNPKDALGIRKIPFHVIPMHVMAEIGLAMMEGGRKYGKHNYREAGVRASVYMDAVYRHLYLQFWEGEDTDRDSGIHHISKAIASLVVLRDSMLMGNFEDDRPVRNPKSEEICKELNKKAGEIIDKYPDCVKPFTQKRKERENES